MDKYSSYADDVKVRVKCCKGEAKRPQILGMEEAGRERELWGRKTKLEAAGPQGVGKRNDRPSEVRGGIS